jgi:hypothetical protein
MVAVFWDTSLIDIQRPGKNQPAIVHSLSGIDRVRNLPEINKP